MTINAYSCIIRNNYMTHITSTNMDWQEKLGDLMLGRLVGKLAGTREARCVISCFFEK